jgi:DNA-binding transcriptional regulator YbjK
MRSEVTSPQAEGRPDAAAAVGTRERILRTTLRVIAEDGIGAVSNRRLAREAGVALGSLTYHFPSQSELLRESLLLHTTEEVERLNAIAESIRAGAPSLAQVLDQVVRLAEDSFDGPEALAVHELHLQAARDPSLQEASKRCFEAFDDLASAALEALGLPSTPEHARAVVALVSGAQLRAIGTGEHEGTALGLGLALLARGVAADG